MAELKTVRIAQTSGTSVVLTSKPGISYKLWDWEVVCTSTLGLVVFFGGKYDDDDEDIQIVHSELVDTTSGPVQVSFPWEKFRYQNPDLFIGKTGKSLSITKGTSTDYSYIRYEEVEA